MRTGSALVLLLAACAPPYPAPPPTERGDVVDRIHGVDIADPYRWLEEQDSPETRAWIDAQNAYAEEIIGDSPERGRMKSRVRALMDTAQIGSPQKGGEFEYFLLRKTGQELPVLYRRPSPEDGELVRIEPDEAYELVLDPHEMSRDRTMRVDIVSVHKGGNLLLYSVRDGGADEIEIRLRDVAAGEDRAEMLPRGLYGSVFFNADGTGFYYTARSRSTGPRVRFHRLGTEMDEDTVVFGDGVGPESFINTMEARDGELLVFTVQHGWARSELFLMDLSEPDTVVPIVTDVDGRFYARAHEGSILVRTNLDAPNNRVVVIDLNDPSREAWQEILPESDDVLQDAAVIDGKLFATYLHEVSAKIRTYELDGTGAGEIVVPEYHNARIRGAVPGKAFLTLTSFTQPEVTYLVDLDSGERELWQEHDVDFDPDGIVVKQVRYESKDGTSIPMYVVHREGLVLDGSAPTLLHGYGGFNSAQAPRFDVMGAIWVEEGGVFALANLRGGSEFGERWHRAGMLGNKQNVFDDFVAAGEWLVANLYTNPNRLVIRGASNGGLLVASALTQRPDLFRAVLCGFPDLDMVRFYTFTETNNMPALLEYGDASIPAQFEFITEYSPYQAVSDGTPYPAVMLTSGDLDTRVPPLQARKMAARLQASSTSGRPIILRYHPKAGHAASRGLPMSQNIEDRAAELTFLLSQVSP